MRGQRFLVGIVTLMMVLLGGSMAEARGHGYGHRALGPAMMGLKTLLELKLTDSQQEDMLRIISKYQPGAKAGLEELRAARRDLYERVSAEAVNETEIRKAFQRVSSAKEDLFLVRIQMMNEMRAVLTPAQMALLKERKAQGMVRLKAGLGAWLEAMGQ